MSYSDGTHFYNAHDILVKKLSNQDIQLTRRVRDLARHNQKVARLRQDIYIVNTARAARQRT